MESRCRQEGRGRHSPGRGWGHEGRELTLKVRPHLGRMEEEGQGHMGLSGKKR